MVIALFQIPVDSDGETARHASGRPRYHLYSDRELLKGRRSPRVHLFP